MVPILQSLKSKTSSGASYTLHNALHTAQTYYNTLDKPGSLNNVWDVSIISVGSQDVCKMRHQTQIFKFPRLGTLLNKNFPYLSIPQ